MAHGWIERIGIENNTQEVRVVGPAQRSSGRSVVVAVTAMLLLWLSVNATAAADAATSRPERVVVMPVVDPAYARIIADSWLLAADELAFDIELNVAADGALEAADWLVGVNADDAEQAGFVLGPELLEQEFILFQRRHLPAIDTLAMATGFVVGAVAGHPAAVYIERNYPQLTVRHYTTLEAMLDAAYDGQLHVFVHSNLLGVFDQQDPERVQALRYSFPVNRQLPVFTQTLYVAVRDNADLDAIERAVTQVRALQQQYLQAQRSLDIASMVSLQRDELQWLLNVESVVVGVPNDSRPILYFDSAGEVRGLDADYLALIGDRARVDFSYQRCGDWDRCLHALEQREIDVLSFSTDTPERRAYAHFTEPYWEAPWAIATPYEALLNVSRFSELEGFRIAITRGYSVIDDIERAAQVDVRIVPSPSAGLDAVAAGQVDGYLDSLPLLVERVREQHAGNMRLNILRQEQGDVVSLAIRDDWPVLRDMLNRSIRTLSDDDEARISERWFDAQFEQGLTRADIMPYVWYTGVAVVAIVVGFLLSNRRLRKEVHRRKKAERKMRHLARHDDLTGLPNRHLLDDRMKQIIAAHQRYKRKFAVLFLDLDGFKEVNDAHGHAVGDALLRQVAERLIESVRAQDTVCRFGGDEFVIILTEQQSATFALQVAQKLVQRITEPYVIEGLENPQVSVSIGVAMYPTHSRSGEELLRLADTAMYEVKREGKNGVRMAQVEG